jgi:hypothetical protein
LPPAPDESDLGLGLGALAGGGILIVVFDGVDAGGFTIVVLLGAGGGVGELGLMIVVFGVRSTTVVVELLL